MQISLLQSAQTYYLWYSKQECANANANEEDKIPNSSFGSKINHTYQRKSSVVK